MKLIGVSLALIPLVWWTAGAAAQCKSSTDELQSATIVYQCPPSDKPVDAANVIVEPGNVSVIEKKADPVKVAEPLPAKPPKPEPKPAEVKTTAAKPEAAEAPRIKPSADKPAQAKSRKATSKSSKQKGSKSSARKSPQVIHLEKPSIGRRIIQFFSF